jgi:hypothetical protein
MPCVDSCGNKYKQEAQFKKIKLFNLFASRRFAHHSF